MWILTWVRTHGPEWEPRTRRDRAADADRLILPDLGGMRLDEIGRLEVRRWRSDLLARGVTPHRANRAVSILSAALAAAVEDGLLNANPCHGLKRIPERRERRQPATLAEVEGIRALVGGADPARSRLIVSLMAYAGLRPSEVPTLAWADVRDATIVVRSAAGGQGREKATKTGSVRTIPVIEALADDLAAVDRDGPLVVGPVNMGNWSGRVWRPARARLAIAATPYSCRHTFASLLIAEGRTPHEVARLLGHSTPALTLSTYGHLFAEAQLVDDESMADAAIRARQEAASI